MKNNQSQWQKQAAQAAAEHRAKEEARAGVFMLETQHKMGRRCLVHDYSEPGMYHITVKADDAKAQPFGHMMGDVNQLDGSVNAPHVELSDIGKMVEEELLRSIHEFYPMVEVQDYVIMPEHMHFIIEVHNTLVSKNGKPQHLGRVIAGFKYGCNMRWMQMQDQRTETAGANPSPQAAGTNTQSAGVFVSVARKVPPRYSRKAIQM